MSVYGVLGGLLKFFKVKDRACISNASFTLHRFSVGILVAFSILTTSRQFFGDPIHCHIETKAISLKVFESYCFYTGTYTLVLTNDTRHSLGPNDSRTIHHNYYQWVCIVLVLQAAVCYIPWVAWKNAEGGKVSKLLAKVSQDPMTETSVEDQVFSLGNFLLNHRGWFNATALKLLLCQAGCLINSLCQLYIIDYFVGGRFLSLGKSMYNHTVLSKALLVVFPRITQCTMEVYGTSGTKVEKSGICSLPINVVNEKIYLVLWFWFLALTIISSLQLLRQVALLAASVRAFISPSLSSNYTSPRQVRQLLSRSSYGDTVLLQLVAANCDSSQFAALVRHLIREQTPSFSQPADFSRLGPGAQKITDICPQDFFSIATKSV